MASPRSDSSLNSNFKKIVSRVMNGSRCIWIFSGVCLMLMFEALTGENLVNVALGKRAAQSSGDHVSGAVDGFRHQDDWGHHCTYTEMESDPWWRVDLQDVYAIRAVTITNANDNPDRLDGAEIWIGNSEELNNQTDRRCGVVSHIPSSHTDYFPCRAAEGRYLTVRLQGDGKILSFCEVEAYQEYGCVYPLPNVALKGEATQSSTAGPFIASKAIDGSRNSNHHEASCSHTDHGDFNPWWRVDLKRTYRVAYVKITNRGDCCSERLDGADILIGDSLEDNGNSNSRCANIPYIGAGKTHTFHCEGGNMLGRYVNVVLPKGAQYLSLCQVEVYAVSTAEERTVHNVAFGKPVESNSTSETGPVSGCKSTSHSDGCCSHSMTDRDPGWKVDLLALHEITAVTIINRQDCCPERLVGVEVLSGKPDSLKSCGVVSSLQATSVYTFSCEDKLGQIVLIRNLGHPKILSLCGVEVYAAPVSRPRPPALTTPSPLPTPPPPPTTSATLEDRNVTLVGGRLCWSDALLYCRRFDGDLLSLHSLEEQRQVERLMENSPFALTDFVWIGLRRSVTSPTWFWMSGASMDFTNWPRESPPGFHTNFCGGLVNGEHHPWDIRHCQEHLNFICQSQIGQQGQVYFYSSLEDVSQG